MKSIQHYIKRTILEGSKQQDFDAWFSKNGLCDKDGKPMLVYHGSGRGFEGLDPDKTNEGLFVADNKEIAESYCYDNGDSDFHVTMREIMERYGYWDSSGEIEYDYRYFKNDDGEIMPREQFEKLERELYNEYFGNPRLFSLYVRNASKGENYFEEGHEYVVYDKNDMWIVSVDKVQPKPYEYLWND